MIPCFLVEPIYGPPGSSTVIDRWRQPGRCITGWQKIDPIKGKPEVGKPHKEKPELFGVAVVYPALWMPAGFVWANETEPHLYIQTEEGGWDIDGRALDCTKPHDRMHRCWVRTGVAPKITVGKSGFTCQAGMFGGPNYHGVLVNGRLRT